LQSEGPWYEVETGRRDGNVTVAEYAANDLAPPDSNIVDVKTFFSVKSLNSKDIAVLFGTPTPLPSTFSIASRADDSNA
jgi:peroxidase